MIIPRVGVGLALLVFGRKAFWLFVSGVGFVLGINVATQVVRVPQDWLVLAIALIGGLLGALLAVLLQQAAVGLAAFVVGGYATLSLIESFGWDSGWFADLPYGRWVAFAVGGVLCAVLIGAVLEWALIVLSSVTGAALVTPALGVQPGAQVPLFAVLLAVGVVIQAFLLRWERTHRPPRSKARRKPGAWR